METNLLDRETSLINMDMHNKPKEEIRTLLAQLQSNNLDQAEREALVGLLKKEVDLELLSKGRVVEETIASAGEHSVAIGRDVKDSQIQVGHQYYLVLPRDPATAAQAALPEYFDLDEIVNVCYQVLLENRRGLIGFGLPYKSPSLLPKLTERLRNLLGRHRNEVKGPFVIDPVSLPVDELLREIRRRYLPLLSQLDITVAVHSQQAQSTDTLWRELNQTAWDINHRLIVTMSVCPDYGFPQRLVPLPPPLFTRQHLAIWMQKVIPLLECDDPLEFTAFWIDALMKECWDGERLIIEYVYEYVEMTLELLKRYPTYPQFRQAIEQRSTLYDQTSG